MSRPRRVRGRRYYAYGLRSASDLSSQVQELHATRKATAEEESAQIPRLFSLCKNVHHLTLCIFPSPGSSRGVWGGGYASEGIEPEILDAMCGMTALRSLTLRQVIDFSEVEVLLPCLPKLKELRLEGGLDNLDGRGDVTADIRHQCRLEAFHLSNMDFESGNVSDDQLVWILGESVGTMKRLDVVVYAGGGTFFHPRLSF